MEKNYDFWNHGIHPITGFFIKDDRIVEVFSSDKYFLKPLKIPKNKHDIFFCLQKTLHIVGLYSRFAREPVFPSP